MGLLDDGGRSGAKRSGRESATEGGSPTVLADREHLPRGLTLRGDHLYFGTYSAIRRVPIDGANVETIADQQSPYDLAADDDGVFWTNWCPGDGSTGSLMRFVP
jgi:hypothetical protein